MSSALENLEKLLGTPRDGALLRYSLGLENAVRMTVYLTDLAHFSRVNEIMAQYVREPYPARAAVGVAGLPRGALVEIDAILQAG